MNLIEREIRLLLDRMDQMTKRGCTSGCQWDSLMKRLEAALIQELLRGSDLTKGITEKQIGATGSFVHCCTFSPSEDPHGMDTVTY